MPVYTNTGGRIPPEELGLYAFLTEESDEEMPVNEINPVFLKKRAPIRKLSIPFNDEFIGPTRMISRSQR